MPKQILLNNFLSDLPSVSISTDNVDRQHVMRPQRWNVKEVQRFMMVFGLISSCFDVLTFAALLLVFQAAEPLFQTAWFVVSLLTELAVVPVLRTRGPALRSRPSRLLLWTTVVVALLSLLLPYAGPVAALFGFTPLPWTVAAAAVGIVGSYVVVTEAAKAWFHTRLSRA